MGKVFVTEGKDPLETVMQRIKVSDAEKGKYCQYRGRDKYCNATSKKTCNKCRFFTPTTSKKLDLILKDRKELEKVIQKQERVIQLYMRICTNQEKENHIEKTRHKEEVRQKVKRCNKRYGDKYQRLFQMY